MQKDIVPYGSWNAWRTWLLDAELHAWSFMTDGRLNKMTTLRDAEKMYSIIVWM